MRLFTVWTNRQRIIVTENVFPFEIFQFYVEMVDNVENIIIK
ncbi:hypothetical protein B4168_2026 [Anoxybacillus flavithermus]|nr:hypothetical protein B4168_2026 [Anoxybacillus flavithermus]